MNLSEKIQAAAAEFTKTLLSIMSNANLSELSALAPKASPAVVKPVVAVAAPKPAKAPRVAKAPGARLPRRTNAEIEALVGRLIEVLQNNPEGLRAGGLIEELGCNPKELPKTVKAAVASGRVTVTGNKRSTTYFAADAAAPAVRRSATVVDKSLPNGAASASAEAE